MTDAPVALVGALDTKYAEYAFVRDRLEAAGVRTVLIDVGILGPAGGAADVTAEDVAVAADADLVRLRREADRASAVEIMARGAAALVGEMREAGGLGGVLVLGGSNAGVVMSRVAAALPFGVPKLLVATIVAGDTRPYVGISDLMMLNPVVDVAGLNSISREVLAHAADALAGMVRGGHAAATSGRRAVACTMFGVTTSCVTALAQQLEQQADEALVFHANGTGGRAMESLVRAGRFGAVADLTTTELADELVGGVCSAGPDRLTAAADRGVPQIVSVGALDMVNFGPLDTVPERYRRRRLLPHNAAVTLMRTDPDESAALGALLAEKVNRSTAACEVHVPARGFSQISVAGAPFHDPRADEALIEALGRSLDPRIPLHVHDLDINDPRFAAAVHAALQRVAPLTEGIPA